MSKIRLNGTTSGYTEITAPATAGDNTITLPSSNGSANQFLKNGSTPGTLEYSTMVEDSSGNLGVGTSSATSLLHLSKTDTTAYDATASDGQVGVGPTIYLENPANANTTVGGQIVFGMRSTPYQTRIGSTGGSTPTLTFGTNGAERARITSGGYFKASDNGSYVNATGTYHELVQSTTATTLNLYASNASYASRIIDAVAVRAANSAYSFFVAQSANYGDFEFNLRGDGQAYADGSWNGGGADYAEYFEWEDGNPNTEDRRGYPVALVGNKIKIAENGDTIIGIVSAAPVVLGDAAWNHWSGKYLRDEFGGYLLDENGDRQLNPDYDPTQPYVPREDRPEWSPVGLMGKLRLRKGQPVAANWIKLRDISATVEEWLVR